MNVPPVKPTGSCSDTVRRWPLGVTVLEPPGRDCGAGQSQMLLVSGPKQLVWSFRTTLSLWPPLRARVCAGRTTLRTEAASTSRLVASAVLFLFVWGMMRKSKALKLNQFNPHSEAR